MSNNFITQRVLKPRSLAQRPPGIWRSSIRAVGIAAAASMTVLVAWELVLAINVRVSPQLPWYPAAAALILFSLWKFLHRKWISRPLMPARGVEARAPIALLLGVLSCICLSLWLAAVSPYTLVVAHRRSIAGTGLVTSYALLAPAFAALVEEIIFRGVIQSALEKSAGLFVALIGTSVLFVAVHWSNVEFRSQWAFYFAFSVLMGFAAWRTDSMLYPLALHTAVNFVGNLVILLNGPFDPRALGSAWRVVLSTAALAAGISSVFIDRAGIRSRFIASRRLALQQNLDALRRQSL